MNAKTDSKQVATMAAPVEILTVAQVRSGKVDVPTVLDEVAARIALGDRVQGSIMWDASLLTEHVAAAEIGKGKRFATAADYAKALGRSQAYVSRLRVLGRAAVVHGIRKGSAEWRFLCSHGDNSQIREAVKGDDSEALRKRIKSAAAEVAEHGRITSGAKTGAKAKAKKTADEKAADKKAAAKATTPPTLGDVREALRQVESMAKTFDTSEPVEKALRALADSLAKRRTTLAAKPTAPAKKAAEKVPA